MSIARSSNGRLSNGSSAVSKSSSTFKSQVESAILKSTEPIQINETQEITANKQRGIWANRCEVCTWKGEVPINEYPINEDACPEVIKKKSCKKLEYSQEIAIRYLKPPAPPAPGEIIIKQEANKPTAPAPPVIIRQQPPRPCTPEPLIIREAPPQAPPCIPSKLITIEGKRLPAPPRKVVVERLAPMPAKPQSVLIERWLPYVEQRRKVVFQAAPPDPIVCPPKNLIIQWETPDVCIKKDIKHLGVICANPSEYIQRYGCSLKKSCDLPQFVKDIRPQCGVELAANKKYNPIHELEGDVCALNLINLECEGLGMYRDQVAKHPCPEPCPAPCPAPCQSCPGPCPCADPCPCHEPCPAPCPASEPCPAADPCPCPNDCQAAESSFDVYSPGPCSSSPINYGSNETFQCGGQYSSNIFSSSSSAGEL